MEKYAIEHWMFIFFLFCVYGWLQESIIESIYHKKLINRGFLKGPYIPIYGFGGLVMLFICMPFKENGFAVFFAGLISCTLLEYFTGWVMETCFGMQFWDYSMLKFTYKNRISLVSSLFWGVLSLYMVYFLFGIVDGIVSMIPNRTIVIIDTILLISMIADFFFCVKKRLNFDNIMNTFGVRIGRLETRFQKPLSFIDRIRGIDGDDDKDNNNDNN